MAKFRELDAVSDVRITKPSQSHSVGGGMNTNPDATTVTDRSIGSIIAETRNLNPENVEEILQYQRDKGLRFGDAAVALGYASADDVMLALARQFHYPYAPAERRVNSPELVALNQPFSVQAESFRAIRSQIMMRLYAEGQERRAIAVVSPDTMDGKSFFSANLAVALAQLGGRTLLVDADMRGPRQHKVFGIEGTSGLSSILAGRAEARVMQQIDGIPSLFVLPVGTLPPNPLELIERPAFGLLMRELTFKFDHVVVDTPAAIYGTDAMVIASRCRSALVVARQNATRVPRIQELLSALVDGSTMVLGAVVNEF